MNAEQNLILKLLGNTPKNEIESLLIENINWQFFLKTATEHRIIPLIFRKLGHFPSVPQKVSVDLRDRAEHCALRNLRFTAQLSNIARIFEEHNIEFLAYKGATLAHLAYGDSSLRQFGDLDILIHKKDFPKVKTLILEDGGKPAWKLTDRQEKAVLKYYYEFPFKVGKHPVLIEVHWAFMESFFVFDYETTEVFRRSQKILVGGKFYPTLSNEDLLLFLCVHGSKHFWKRLSWIYDVGKLVETQQIQWNLVNRLAVENGCRRMLSLGLFLAKDLFKTELPPESLKQIEADEKIQFLAGELKNQLFDDKISSKLSTKDIHLKMRERRRDKITYARRLFTTKFIDSLFMPMGRPR